MRLDESRCSRRSVLSMGAAAVAGLALSRCGAFGAAEEGQQYGGLPLGVQSYTLRDRSFEKALDAIQRDLKLRYVEIWPNHLAGMGPSKLKQLLK